MSEIVSNSKVEEGNTQTPSSTPKKKQVPARIHHFFTYNNYDSKDILYLTKMFDQYCYMYCFQEEIGDSGTPHLQGVISCHKPTRDTVFGINKIHWEKPRNVKESYIYCCKSETRSGNVYTKNYTAPIKLQLNLYDWQLELIDLLKVKPDDRKVMWYWSSNGNTGKSTFCKYLILNMNALFLSKGKYSDIINIIYKDGMANRDIVVIDLPRNNGNKVSYDAIESIKNGLICNTKFETGYKVFNSPHVLIFSNEEPEYDKLSNDRWIVKCIDTINDTKCDDSPSNFDNNIDKLLDKGLY